MRKWMKIANKIRFQKRSPENRWMMYPSGHMLACRISFGTKPYMWETPVIKVIRIYKPFNASVDLYQSHNSLWFTCLFYLEIHGANQWAAQVIIPRRITKTPSHAQEQPWVLAVRYVTKCSLFNLSDLSWRCSVFCCSKGKVNTVTSLKPFILGYKWPIASRHHFLHAHSELALAQQVFWFRKNIAPKSRATMVGGQSASQSTLLLPPYRYATKDLESSVWFSIHFTGLQTRITTPFSLWLPGEFGTGPTQTWKLPDKGWLEIAWSWLRAAVFAMPIFRLFCMLSLME